MPTKQSLAVDGVGGKPARFGWMTGSMDIEIRFYMTSIVRKNLVALQGHLGAYPQV